MAAVKNNPRKDGRYLKPLNGQPRPIPCFIAFDTETNGNNYIDEETGAKPGEMKCACVYGEYLSKDGKRIHKVDQTFTLREDLSAFFHTLNSDDRTITMIVAYNLAYDMWYIFDEIDFESMITVGTRIITAKLTNGIRMMDLANHTGVGTKLEDWFDKLNLKEKGIVKTLNPESMPLKELIDHCRNDTRATWEVAEHFKRVYESIGVSFKLTTSSVAMNLYKRQFLNEEWWRKDEKFENNKKSINDMEREAYYGGRVECFSRGIHNVQSYDANSTYVSAMRDGIFPMPNGSHCTYFPPRGGASQFKHYFEGKNIKPNLMIVHCRVKAPKSRVMVLPWRDPESGKLIFPWGEFSGWWTSPELKAALKYGYEILEVKEFILYRKPVSLFRQYAEFCYNNRLAAKARGDSAFDTIWKLMGNGLYGKFGQRNDVDSGFRDTPPLGREGQQLTKCNVYGRELYLVSSGEKEDGVETFPCIAAFVTAYARLKLLEKLKEHEEDCIYADTDCVKYPDFDIEPDPESKRHLTSKELGEWKYEPENSGMMVFLKPKLYGHVTKEFAIDQDYDFATPSGEVFIIPGASWKIKGLGGKCGDLVLDLQNMRLTGGKRTPTKLRDSLRRNKMPNVWYDMEKSMDIIDDKRVWIGKDSEPLYVNDTEEK